MWYYAPLFLVLDELEDRDVGILLLAVNIESSGNHRRSVPLPSEVVEDSYRVGASISPVYHKILIFNVFRPVKFVSS